MNFYYFCTNCLNMKKIFLPIVCAFALVSCGSNIPANVDEYEKAVQTLVDNADKAFKTASEKLEGEKLQEQLSAIESKLDSDFLDLTERILKKSKNADLCVAALKESAGMMAPEKTLKYIADLPKEARESEEIGSIKTKTENQLASAVGNMFLDFEADGVKFSDFIGKGKVFLVDFWASWCGPCKREIPNIRTVYEKYAGEEFDVLSVAVWDKPEDTAAAAAEHGIIWNQMVNTGKVATELYGIMGIPQIMLFGADGKILKKDLRGSEIEKAVREALGK